jgi:hypothetical protein
MPTPSKDYRTIPLTQGQVAIVDADDFEWLSRFNWSARWCKCTQSFYATCHEPGAHRVTLLMHRVILGLSKGDRRKGDHQNHNTLDNRRENLRIADFSQNARNSRQRKDNTSGFKGVSAYRKKWKAQICVNKEIRYLGVYETRESAYAAYCKASSEFHQDFSCVGH